MNQICTVNIKTRCLKCDETLSIEIIVSSKIY